MSYTHNNGATMPQDYPQPTLHRPLRNGTTVSIGVRVEDTPPSQPRPHYPPLAPKPQHFDRVSQLVDDQQQAYLMSQGRAPATVMPVWQNQSAATYMPAANMPTMYPPVTGMPARQHGLPAPYTPARHMPARHLPVTVAPTMVPDGRSFLPVFDPMTVNRPQHTDRGFQSQTPWEIPHPGLMAQSMPRQAPSSSGFMVDDVEWPVPYQMPPSTSGLPQFQPPPPPTEGFNGPMMPRGSPLPMPLTPGKPCRLASPPMAYTSLFEPPPPDMPDKPVRHRRKMASQRSKQKCGEEDGEQGEPTKKKGRRRGPTAKTEQVDGVPETAGIQRAAVVEELAGAEGLAGVEELAGAEGLAGTKKLAGVEELAGVDKLVGVEEQPGRQDVVDFDEAWELARFDEAGFDTPGAIFDEFFRRFLEPS